MPKKSADSQPSTILTDSQNPQLNDLLAHLKESRDNLAAHGIDPIFKEFGLNNSQDIDFIFQDIALQQYKFYNRMPGELIKLSSMITPPLGITIYATRDIEGRFQIILQKMNPITEENLSYEITKLPYLDWKHEMALQTRLRFLATQIPMHSSNLINENENHTLYFDLVHKNMNAISSLTEGTTLKIPADLNQDLSHDLEVLRTASGEYKILLKTAREDAPYIQIDTPENHVWHEKNNVFLDAQAITFLERIQIAKNNLEQSLLPAGLNQLISKASMLDTYNYMLNAPHVVAQLMSGEGFRISKEFSTLVRTLNIVRDQNGDYMLMLETKRKLASGVKDAKRMIGEGTFGTVKPAWRIDCQEPEEWVNKVSKGETAQEADYEALFSQTLVNSREIGKHNTDTLNITLLGELFTSKDVVKRSQYSKRAIGDLKQVLKNHQIVLTTSDKIRITKNILEGLALMHQQGKIHQDIKLPNIFIYQDQNGYYAKIADFGISYDSNSPLKKPSLGSSGYESPEIILANEAPDAMYHEYYHRSVYTALNSYGFRINRANSSRTPRSEEAISFREPHPANDMWAIGILLFELNYGHLPKHGYSQDESKIQTNPLLRSLLKAKREERITCVEAITIAEKTWPERELAPALIFRPLLNNEAASSSDHPPIMIETINYKEFKALVRHDFLNLKGMPEASSRAEQEQFIRNLEKLRNTDIELFKVILEGQSMAELQEIHDFLEIYKSRVSSSPPLINASSYPDLIKQIDAALVSRRTILDSGKNEKAHCDLAKEKAIEYINYIIDNNKRSRFDY